MADICIIYASQDRVFVEALAELLAPPYDVWWGEKILQGNYRAEIERQLSGCRCVLAVWSKHSRENQNVIDEAQFALKRSIPILPLHVGKNVEPPIGLGGFQRISFDSWTGDANGAPAKRLLKSLTATIGAPSRQLDRVLNMQFRKSAVPLPVFFNSVSSHETQLTSCDATEALRIFGAKAILVSAYDTGKGQRSEAMNASLKKCRASGAVVLLDSGNYEASRLSDKTWKPARLHKALRATPHDIAFIFDDMEPPSNAQKIAARVISAVERDARHTSAPILPIVHLPRREDGSYATELLSDAIKLIAKELRPLLVAVPERELGNGLAQRARTIVKTRRSLNELGFYQPIHLLGTGNPISIAVLAAAGADSFDGLEWCRVAADAQTAALYHFQHYDFFAYQSQVAASPVTQSAANDESLSFAGRVVMHNLSFFQEWMNDLRNNMGPGKIEVFLAERLPKGAYRRQIEPALAWKTDVR